MQLDASRSDLRPVLSARCTSAPSRGRLYVWLAGAGFVAGLSTGFYLYVKLFGSLYGILAALPIIPSLLDLNIKLVEPSRGSSLFLDDSVGYRYDMLCA